MNSKPTKTHELKTQNSIPIAKPLIGKEEERAVLEVLRSGKLAQGEKVAKFEEDFAKYCGTKYAVATDNGTSALIVALVAAGVGPGDEVITTPFTFIATANAIVFTGAKPVFVDIEEKTFNINPELIEGLITPRTKAILPVHLYGLMADMKTINEVARNHKLIVIEDAAQAHGADIRGKKAGSWGTAGCFSFYPSKNMTTGEGGMITTSDKKLAIRAKLIRNQGMAKRYYHDMIGYNFRMTEIAAAIGIEQLKKLEKFTKKRIANATYLSSKLSTMNSLPAWQTGELITPHVPEGYRHVFHQYTLRVGYESPLSRDQLLKRLTGNGVEARIYYPKLLSSERVFESYKKSILTKAEKIHSQILSLPIHPSLKKKDLNKMVEVIKDV